MQALYLLALEPVAESTSDPNSYGFRINRSTADAMSQIFVAMSQKGSARWILEADIKGCFDHINHDWLESNVPMDKTILRKWLKAGLIYKGQLQATEAGTPQGGIISPTLANVTLNGLERELVAHLGAKSGIAKTVLPLNWRSAVGVRDPNGSRRWQLGLGRVVPAQRYGDQAPQEDHRGISSF